MRRILNDIASRISTRLAALGKTIGFRMDGQVGDQLRQWHLLPAPESELEPIESAVHEALDTISPAQSFRERLRENLSIAAASTQQGVVLDYPRPVRQMLVVGISAGVIVATLGAFVAALIFKSAKSRQPRT